MPKEVSIDFNDLPQNLQDLIMESIGDVYTDIGQIPTHPLFDEAIRLIGNEIPSTAFDKIVGCTKPLVVSMADAAKPVEGLHQWMIDTKNEESLYSMCETLILFGFLLGQEKTLLELDKVMNEVEALVATGESDKPFDLPIAPYQKKKDDQNGSK